MDFIKKNTPFCIELAICLVAFAVGGFLAYNASTGAQSAERELADASSRLTALEGASPAPTEANVQASEQNINKLLAELNRIRENLQRGSRLTTSGDGVAVMSAIQQYITDFQGLANARVGPDGEPDPIEITPDFAFGFEQYINEATPLDDEVRTRALDQQRQILEFLVNQLIASNPDSITEVRRELIEQAVRDGGVEQQKGFAIDPVVSARVPGAIDTKAFSLTFTGYTDSLRIFLNNLARPELPIVVRSIEVDRPSGSETVDISGGEDAFGGLFGAFPASDQAAEEKAQQPVISENISRFTVVVEFIEIVLPDETEAEPS